MAPVTSYIDFTALVYGIGARTNATGGAVDDITAEELRLAGFSGFTEGALTDDAFLVQWTSAMGFTFGSGTAKRDTFVVAGEASGQGGYVVREEAATVAGTVPAAEAAQTRTDEIYLVVLDSPYDSNTLGTASAPVSLPRIGYRKGDPGGANPGVDSLWKASALLSRVTVPAAASALSAGAFADVRDFAHPRPRAATIEWTAEAAAPSGALLCDGSAISRTTYRRLFRLIGTTYGVGDGSTTFNVPSLKGRVPVGRDAAQTEFDALGETGGAKTHTLTQGEMPVHAHGIGGSPSTGGANGITNMANNLGVIQQTENSGSGGAHNNLQPYLVLNPIIWT